MGFDIMGDFTLFQVLVGAVLLFASVILTFQIRKKMPDEFRAEWRKTSNFMLLFFAGYVLFVLILVGNLSYDIEPVTASMFLVNACFVYLIMMLIKAFSQSLSENNSKIREYIDILQERNDSLAYEIEERERSEERLRLYGKALESMHVGVMITNNNGTIVYVNPVNALMHGYDDEDLVGKDVGILMQPGSRSKLNPDDMREEGTTSHEGVNIRSDGSTFPVQLMSSAVLNPEGEPIGIVTVCEDITSRKRNEESLATYNQHLESLVKKRSSDDGGS